MNVRAPKMQWQHEYPHFDARFQRLSERSSFQATVPYPQQIEAGVV